MGDKGGFGAERVVGGQGGKGAKSKKKQKGHGAEGKKSKENKRLFFERKGNSTQPQIKLMAAPDAIGGNGTR